MPGKLVSVQGTEWLGGCWWLSERRFGGELGAEVRLERTEARIGSRDTEYKLCCVLRHLAVKGKRITELEGSVRSRDFFKNVSLLLLMAEIGECPSASEIDLRGWRG